MRVGRRVGFALARRPANPLHCLRSEKKSSCFGRSREVGPLVRRVVLRFQSSGTALRLAISIYLHWWLTRTQKAGGDIDSRFLIPPTDRESPTTGSGHGLPDVLRRTM